MNFASKMSEKLKTGQQYIWQKQILFTKGY